MAPEVAILKSSNLICSLMVRRIEPKLSGRHWGDMVMTWRIAKTILLRCPRWLSQQPLLRSLIGSSPGALLHISLCRGQLTMVRLSFLCLSLTFHIFNISIRIISMMTPARSATLFHGDLIMKFLAHLNSAQVELLSLFVRHPSVHPCILSNIFKRLLL